MNFGGPGKRGFKVGKKIPETGPPLIHKFFSSFVKVRGKGPPGNQMSPLPRLIMGLFVSHLVILKLVFKKIMHPYLVGNNQGDKSQGHDQHNLQGQGAR
jgi:hypothetical protein